MICTACCGEGRETTIDCPLTCEYLAEAHRHEKKPPTNPDDMPGKDVPIDDEFLHTNEFLIVLLGSALSEAVHEHSNSMDADAVEALEGLATTWRTLISGIYYESKPVNPIAADMFESVKARVDDIKQRMTDADATQTLPDATVLGVITFLQRVAFGMNNGRPKCKAFLVFLEQFYVDMQKEEAEEAESLAPDEPRVIL